MSALARGAISAVLARIRSAKAELREARSRSMKRFGPDDAEPAPHQDFDPQPGSEAPDFLADSLQDLDRFPRGMPA